MLLNFLQYFLCSYLLNPFAIASCVAQSTDIVTNLSVALALFFALLGSPSLSMCFVSFAAYKSLYPIMLVVPLTLILVGKVTN
jgi:phosphatidylinositol glycan class U